MGSCWSQGAADARQELEVSRLESCLGIVAGWREGDKWCCPVSQLVLVLLVGGAREIEPGQLDLECLSCHVLCGGTERVLPAAATVPVQCNLL